MIIIIHLIENKTITFNYDYTQEHINNFYKLMNSNNDMIHYLDPSGKNYIIPKNKILYIETKQNL